MDKHRYISAERVAAAWDDFSQVAVEFELCARGIINTITAHDSGELLPATWGYDIIEHMDYLMERMESQLAELRSNLPAIERCRSDAALEDWVQRMKRAERECDAAATIYEYLDDECEAYKGCFINAAQNAGLTTEQINSVLSQINDSIESLSADEAAAIYRDFNDTQQ